VNDNRHSKAERNPQCFVAKALMAKSQNVYAKQRIN